jgi:vancomycin resistance protein YoaR
VSDATPSTGGRALTRTVLATGAVLVALTFGFGLLVLVQQARVLPNTTIAGVDVSGANGPSVVRLLGPFAAAWPQPTIELVTPEVRLQLPGDVVGLHIDLAATADLALARGRNGPTAPLQRIRALWSQQSVPLVLTLDADALAAWVDEAADELDRDEHVGRFRVRVDATGRPVDVDVEGPRGSLTVDRAATLDALSAAMLANDGTTSVGLVFEATMPPAPRRAIEDIADRVRAALEEPILLLHDGRRVDVAPERLALLLEPGERTDDLGRRRPTVTVPDTRVQQLLLPEARDILERAAIDARFVTPSPQPGVLDELGDAGFRPVRTSIGLEPGQSDVRLSASLLARQLESLVLSGHRIADADVIERPARLSGDAARAGAPTHLLGSFTTYHAAGADRNINIRQLADTIDDTIVAPGEVFSINELSGPRRCGEGYVPAGTIIRGELVDTCGGGVSQLGTTVFNAAYFAGVPLVQAQAHSFFISRYPPGREATLSYPDLDVRFLNDTDGFIVLRTSHTPTSITVALYGVPRWEEVRATHGERRDPTDFARTERVVTTLAPGARRLVQSGGGGFTITVTRTRLAPEGGQAPPPERLTTVYRPQARIVEIGASPPAPTPAPAPSTAATPGQ